MTGYQVLGRRKGRGELRRFSMPVVTFTPWQAEWDLPYLARVNAFATVAPGTVLLATYLYTRIYTSTDYGETWEHTHSWDSFYGYVDHIVNAGNGNVVMGGPNGTDVFYSSDYGITWTKGSSPATFFLSDMVFDGEGQLFASYGNDASVMRSTNNGKDWYRMGTPDTGSYRWTRTNTIAPLGSGVLLAGTWSEYNHYGPPDYPGGVYRSNNNGVNWTRLYLFDGGETETSVNKLLYLGGGAVLAMVSFYDTETYKFYRSSDSGNTWAEITLGTGEYRVLDMITLGSGKALISVKYNNARGKFLLTKNYGVTWVEILDIGENIFAEKIHATTPQIILAGAGQKVLKFTALGL